MTVADLTPDRLAELRRITAELRRIAVEITLGTYEWRIIETALALLDRIEALDLVRHSGLNAIAEECHRLACLRHKYPDGWTVYTGWLQVYMEIWDWLQEAKFEGKRDEAERIEYGDLLYTVLSLGSHMGYDVEQELRDAIQRNAAKARSGE